MIALAPWSDRWRRCVRLGAPPMLVLLLAGAPFGAGRARADTDQDYGAKLVLVLDWLRRSLTWVDMNRRSAPLCQLAHAIADQHLELVNHMVPPPSYRLAHPHIVLVAEATERAFDACSHGDVTHFRSYLLTARSEMGNLEGILVHLRIHLRQIPR